MQTAILVPLRSFENTSGLLCFTFNHRRSFSSKDINLITAIAEIAAASLRRALILETLEKQVSLRTQQLSTLYNINTIANESLPLDTILQRLLAIALEAMDRRIGTIHLLDPAGDHLYLAAQQNLDPKLLPHYTTLRLNQAFGRTWSRPVTR
jgi:GAF domain-containing protein